MGACVSVPQTTENNRDYRTDLPHPRLLLPQRRVSLLRKESQRQSLRWVQFHTLVGGKVTFPEPGFALALYHVAADSDTHGKQAVDWALGPGSDLRQLALVYDWCQRVLGPSAPNLAAKIRAALDKSAQATDVATVRSRVLAAFAISGDHPEVAVAVIKSVVERWWKQRVLEALQQGRLPFAPGEHAALFELLHVLRDNLDIDLRETSAKFFTTLPIYHILAHYPAPFPAAENDYRIPLMAAHGEPDLRQAALARAAGLSMVAYDNNSQEMQFVQGWLIQDRYLLRGTFGIPYEFLWANPYQPGLSFHYLPNIYHDPVTGRLIIRSTWEDDAVWYYQAGGVTQMFQGGEITNIRPGAISEPVVMGNTVLMPAALSSKFAIQTDEPTTYYFIGLKPNTRYEMEVDDEETRELKSDLGGVLPVRFPQKRTAGVRLHEFIPPR
jgi:hypothetical protein